MVLASDACQVDLYNVMVMTFLFSEPGWEQAMTPRK